MSVTVTRRAKRKLPFPPIKKVPNVRKAAAIERLSQDAEVGERINKRLEVAGRIREQDRRQLVSM